jgi:hypothetical protein
VILSHLGWGMLCILLGIDDALMWNRILQHCGRLLRILLCLLRGRLRRRRRNTPRVFQPFEIGDLWTMVSVMTIDSTKGTRVYGFNRVPPLAFVVIAPLGVLVPLVRVAPSGLLLWGLIPTLIGVVGVPIPSFPSVIVRRVRWVGCIQLFKILILLSSGRLNKIDPHIGMWGSHRLWRSGKWEIWILWCYGSIRYIGRRGAFACTIR